MSLRDGGALTGFRGMCRRRRYTRGVPPSGFRWSIRVRTLAGIALIAVLVPRCGSSPTQPTDTEVCGSYLDWRTSPYVLPYAIGLAFTVIQGNCSAPGNGHRGSERYGYDFDMPIGTEFIAIRAGVVVHVEESHSDGQIAPTGLDNYIVIRHDDGSHALYGHLTRSGALVTQGDLVSQTQTIGRSGNTGNTNNIPHLHVSVHACDPVTTGSTACPSQPITFRNTTANPNGLQQGQRYTALP